MRRYTFEVTDVTGSFGDIHIVHTTLEAAHREACAILLAEEAYPGGPLARDFQCTLLHEEPYGMDV